jgi:hypothetical protein
MAGAPAAAFRKVFGADFYRAFPVVPEITGKSCHPDTEMSD